MLCESKRQVWAKLFLMTLILAWKDKRNVFIVADTAVTRINVGDQSVQDALKKGHLAPAPLENNYR